MKRYWHEHEYKRIRQRLAAKSLQRDLLSRKKRRLQRRRNQGVPELFIRIANEFKHLPIRPALAKAPSLMCCLKNPDGMAAFIDDLRYYCEKKVPVLVDLSEVEELQLNAITVLLAVMVQFKSRGIKFNGTTPINESVRKILVQSNFFNHLGDHYSQQVSYELPGTSIYTHGNRLVDSELSHRIIRAATKTIWGTERRCNGVQRTLIELMMNTNNHAAPCGKDEKHWWLSTQHIKSEQRVIFCFVDFGVGVFTSLKRKPSASKFFGILEKISDGISRSRPEILLEKILNGTMHMTATGKYYRGKGLPGIYEVLKENRISNLSLITNNVYFTSSNGAYHRLKNGFSGTFISWELNSNNESLPNVT